MTSTNPLVLWLAMNIAITGIFHKKQFHQSITILLLTFYLYTVKKIFLKRPRILKILAHI